jgi:hypothetical protein
MAVTGNEGGPISNQDAQAWITNFKNAYPNETWSHLFGINIVNQVKAQTGCLGMRFYNAIDPQGVKKIIIYGVGSSGDGLNGCIAEYAVPCPPTANCTMAVTGNEGAAITSQNAVTWIANFKTAFPTGIWAHLFGMNVINSVLAQSGCVGIRVHHALDPQGVRKIIIYGVNASGVGLTTYIAEFSTPCPPSCGRP